MPSGRLGETLVVPFVPDDVPEPLVPLVPAGVLERWRSADRGVHAPRLVAVTGPDGWSGAALVTARPHTAYLKVVDAVGDVAAVVEAVVALARTEGCAQVKWEGWTVTAADAARAGFAPLQAPLADAGDTGGLTTGYVRWLGGAAVVEPPYYRQTTDFSCGAVVALVAQVQAGAVDRAEIDRPAELTLWRAATNFNACEPVGLGVAVRRAWPASPVTIALDVDRPVILEVYPEADREWRAVLQRESRAEAGRLGVPIDAERLSVPRLRAALGKGEQVLLLISLATMQGFPVPHWVLAHGTLPGAVVVEDPWVHVAAGETWVDAHLLPVPDDALEDMAAWEGDRFRGAVRIGPPERATGGAG
ncbi:peptidase C39 family protein [Microbacterium sp. 18062]|uniref:peptidase C39 family protein n=1 Tax=Microbacterium sp. 18062 TaxID=2681410 RepID=UPI00135C8594|nr:peptidase C39 family protein [Microbacterium sp. 18062]